MISPWALAVLAAWLAVMGWATYVFRWAFVTVGDGPCGDPCVSVTPPIDWFPVVGMAVVTATLVVAVPAGFVLLARQRLSWPWLSAVITVWLVVGFFAFPWVQDLELFKTYYSAAQTGGLPAYTIDNEPVLSELLAAGVAAIAAATLTGLVLFLPRVAARLRLPNQ